jgi:hypothetical protein
MTSCTLLTAALPAQDVSGFPNPHGGRWIAVLDTVGTSDGAESVSFGVFLADTMYFGEFVVRPELAPIALIAPDPDCSWDQEGFAGRFNFLELYGGPERSDCRIEMRLVAKPDMAFVGWWCQGSWSDCRRQGPATLHRDN